MATGTGPRVLRLAADSLLLLLLVLVLLLQTAVLLEVHVIPPILAQWLMTMQRHLRWPIPSQLEAEMGVQYPVEQQAMPMPMPTVMLTLRMRLRRTFAAHSA